jgi:hypothetical protein
MKYYNSELESSNRNFDEKVVKELLDNVKKSIDKSLTKLGKQMSKRCMSGHNTCTIVSIIIMPDPLEGTWLFVYLQETNKHIWKYNVRNVDMHYYKQFIIWNINSFD